MVVLYRAIDGVCDLFIAILCIRALCSWLYGFGSQTIYKIGSIATRLTEFIVAPCRRLISRYNTGMFDWSVLLAFLVVVLVRDIALRLLIAI